MDLDGPITAVPDPEILVESPEQELLKELEDGVGESVAVKVGVGVRVKITIGVLVGVGGATEMGPTTYFLEQAMNKIITKDKNTEMNFLIKEPFAENPCDMGSIITLP
jgi:hypothetical protein